jgi:galactose oxidase
MSLGNAWHLPGNVELPGTLGMRDPVFLTNTNKPITIYNGNQFQGGGNAGNQLQDGSFVMFKQKTADKWSKQPMNFSTRVGNNKYFSAAIDVARLSVNTIVEYYIVVAYDDRETTYLQSDPVDPSGLLSKAVASEDQAKASPFTFIIDSRDKRGQWDETFPLLNVGVHASLLKNGLVLMWGRRDDRQQAMNVIDVTGNLPNPATCTPFLLNPKARTCQKTPQPTMAPDNKNANLFCSGHNFLPDGRLLVVGGHDNDSWGLKQSCIYNPDAGTTGTWTADAVMGNGRWYPTVTALPLGVPLVTSGSYRAGDKTPNNTDTQLWNESKFLSTTSDNLKALDLYPRIHVASSGIVYAISLANGWSLDVAGAGTWTKVEDAKVAKDKRLADLKNANTRPEDELRLRNTLSDYSCSVQYNVDKVLFIGGGNPPVANAAVIDLTQKGLAWESIDSMNFARRQHNATILADGTVLVTGGTRGSGGPDSFNDLSPGQPVHIAELWDPETKKWTMMAPEQTDRCYHSIALLLPDARVLTAGSGEFQINGMPNLAEQSHYDAQIFSPPYLLQDGVRPEIKSADKKVEYGSEFNVVTPQANQIKTVSLIGLSSVTHSMNTGQRYLSLSFTHAEGLLKVTAPTEPKFCPPGFYMLFILSNQGKPSVAEIIQIVETPAIRTQNQAILARIEAAKHKSQTALQVRRMVRSTASGTRIEIGITPSCPYGLSACWGGAYDALSSLDGVKQVDPIPHASGSTASVFLADPGLPDLDVWSNQFNDAVRDVYGLRGFEAALTGTVEASGDSLMLVSEGLRPVVELVPLEPGEKIQWDRKAERPQTVTPEEAAAHMTLARFVSSGNAKSVSVTGPVNQTKTGYKLQVRLLQL